MRALTFDNAIRKFRSTHREAPVVALGERLHTSFWRIADRTVRWISADLPEIDRNA